MLKIKIRKIKRKGGKKMKINECRNKDVCFVRSDCNVFDASRIMCENHIGCIPICDEQRNVVGILTDRDIILRAVACDKNVKTTPVSEIMTKDVCTCSSEQNISEAENTMASYQIRRLPVVDQNNQVVGILTMGDLARKSGEIGSQSVSTTIGNICNCKGSIQNSN